MKSKIILTLFILVTGTYLGVQAQPIVRHDARHCIHRTGLVLIETQRAVRVGKVYTGDLARAVAHQRYAKQLFEQGKFLRAIHQSIRARNLAFVALQANKGAIRAEWRLDESESRYSKSMPPEKELDGEVPGYANAKDDAVLNADISDVNMGEK